MLQLMSDVCQVSARRFDASNHRERFFNAQVARMRLVTQGVEDEDAQALQQAPAPFGETVNVGAISHVVDAESEHVELGVDQGNGYDALAQKREWLFGDLPEGQLV